MKKQENEVRKIFIKIRMNDEELQQVKKKQQQTTERSLSEYIRNVSMQKPVTVKYRNQSADDFLKQMDFVPKEHIVQFKLRNRSVFDVLFGKKIMSSPRRTGKQI